MGMSEKVTRGVDGHWKFQCDCSHKANQRHQVPGKWHLGKESEPGGNEQQLLSCKFVQLTLDSW